MFTFGVIDVAHGLASGGADDTRDDEVCAGDTCKVFHNRNIATDC
jgi:hypothetical protein